MTDLLPELAATLPPVVQLDGELVALDSQGAPDFHRLGSRMLRGRPGISIVLFVFDLLAVEGLPTIDLPYAKRWELLEELCVEGRYVRLVATFEDGQALFEAICERRLEGVVAKRISDRYQPGDRGWVKTKNRKTVRFQEELKRARRGVRVNS